MIIGYLLAMAALILFIPWLYTSLVITLVQDIRKPHNDPIVKSSPSVSYTSEEQEEEEMVDEDMEFYDYMCGEADPEPQVYYEDDKSFVFPRIKTR